MRTDSPRLPLRICCHTGELITSLYASCYLLRRKSLILIDKVPNFMCYSKALTLWCLHNIRKKREMVCLAHLYRTLLLQPFLWKKPNFTVTSSFSAISPMFTGTVIFCPVYNFEELVRRFFWRHSSDSSCHYIHS